MHQEVLVLAWGAVLLFVHIFLAIHFKTKQYGPDWNMGPRDGEMPPLNPVAARLERARDNYQETFPIAVIALFGVVLAGRTSEWTMLGGWLWLAARVVYLPLYWTGVKGWRTLAYMAGMIGLLMVLVPLLLP
ncbi:MAG: hypothetical protein EOP02_30855 [Proteobacteria bacterium]|nr:MAG: hypothetical protein EOP02_30855 [Pseudomonadota bacterium]